MLAGIPERNEPGMQLSPGDRSGLSALSFATRTAGARVRNSVFPLCLLLVLLAASPILSSAQSPWSSPREQPAPDYPDITVNTAWLAERTGASSVVIVDARGESAFLKGHIPGSMRLPVSDLPDVESRDDIPALCSALGEAGLSGDERLVCYGSDTWSGEAARLFWLLELAGARRVALLDGGIAGWKADGHPVSSGASDSLGREHKVSWKQSPEDALLATTEGVRDSYGRDGVEIVDARGPNAWAGPVGRDRWAEPPRVGHIPQALPFDFTTMLMPDGSLREPSETRELFSRLGPRPANPVYLGDTFIVYGEGAYSDGALGYFLLRRAGINNVCYYPGGFAAWASDAGLPLVRLVGADELMWRLARGRRLFHSEAPTPGFAFFDVRHPADYARGHIQGSISLRSDYFADSLDARIDRYWPGLKRSDTPIVTYCYGENCIRSRATSTAAARAGFIHVQRFLGGLDAWRAAGGSLVSSPWPPEERP
jgi:thiosulfate/3-mercaptopyruvate sulfurtransferase